MKISYSAKYSGYIPVLRSILLLVKDKVITLPQLATYIYLVMQADYDARHIYNYSAIVRNDKELAEEFGLDPTTIYRHRKQLIKAGLLTEKNGITKITNLFMFELGCAQKLVKLQPSNMQGLFVKHQDNIASFKTLIANMQEVQPSEIDQSFNVSSKGESSTSLGGVNESLPRLDEQLSDKEIDDIIDDLGRRALPNKETNLLTTNPQKTLDQMSNEEKLRAYKEAFGEEVKWTDENVKEEIGEK